MAACHTHIYTVQVPNLVCNCVCLSPSGTEIVSGWSDGKVRAFGPQSGKLLYVINDAHKIIGVRPLHHVVHYIVHYIVLYMVHYINDAHNIIGVRDTSQPKPKP